MSRKQFFGIGSLILFVATLSSLVAYRAGWRRATAPAATLAGGPQGPPGKCVDFREAASLVGSDACLSGKVLRVFTSRAGNTFLDFCPDYRNCAFSSVIFASDREKFGELGTLTGRNVEIRGFVRTYEGRAEIIVHDPRQIALAH